MLWKKEHLEPHKGVGGPGCSIKMVIRGYNKDRRFKPTLKEGEALSRTFVCGRVL